MTVSEFVQLKEGLLLVNLKGSLLLCLVALLSVPAISSGQHTISDSLRAEQLLSLGLEENSGGNYIKANRLLCKAATLFKRSGYPFKAAHCYNHASSNFRLAGKLDSAEVNAQKALEAIGELPTDDHTEQIRAYTNLGLIETTLARYDRSLEWLQKAYKLANSSSVSPFLQTTVLGSLGYVQDDLGNYDEALSYYRESLDILSGLENPPKERMAKLYNNIGYTYSNLGLYDEALKFHRRELELGLEIKDEMHPDVAIAYINIGSSHYRRGDCGQAVLYFQKSLEAALNAFGEDHEMVYTNYDNLALCYIETKAYDTAIVNLERSAEIKKRLRGPGHPALADTYKNLGLVYAQQKNFHRALSYSKKALDIQRRSLGERHPKLADTYNKTGTYFARQNQPDSAFHYLNKAQELGQAVLESHHPLRAQTFAAMAGASAKTGRYQQAAAYYQQALQLLSGHFKSLRISDNPDVSDIQYPVYATDILFDKAQMLHSAYALEGNTDYLKASLYAFHVLSQLLDHLQIGYVNKQSKLTVGRKSHNIYERAIQAAYDLYREDRDPVWLDQIFYFAEKSKARILLESVVKNGASQYTSIPDSLLEYERSLEGKVNAVRHKMDLLVTGPSARDGKLAAMRDSLITLNQQLAQYTSMLGQRYPRYYDLKYSNRVPSTGTIQKQLSEKNLTVLEYYFGEDSLFAIIITPDDLIVRSLSADPSLGALVGEFNNTITRREDAAYRALGHHLYRILLEPLKPFIPPSTRLLIVPDGELALLPFEALLTREVSAPPSNFRDLPYLLWDHEISYTSSITLSTAVQTSRSRKYDTDFLAFAPGFTDGVPGWQGQTTGVVNRSAWNPLPFSKMEVTNISTLFNERINFWDFLLGDGETKLFFEEDASESVLKKAASGLNARYVHLATHAFVSEDQSELAGILLYPDRSSGEDGILFAHEIYNLSMNAELVVLSACDTGRGSVVKGEGIMSLSRAFQYAGADNLLVSLWKVEDRSSAKLMVTFYRNLLDRQDKARALHSAKQSLVRGVEFAHPFYWAPFILIRN